MKRQILAIVLAGLASASMAFAAGGGTLRIATDRQPRNLNPVFADDSASAEIISYVFDPLLRTNEKGEYEPVLAASLPDISKDGKTITFKLRKGIKWHDGVELTAEDVKFSLELILKKETNSPNIGYMDVIEKIEIIDPYTFRFRLADVESQIMRDFSSEWIVPKHILSKMTKDEMEKGDYSRLPIGNGSFKIAENRTNERIVLVTNNSYYGKAPKLDGMVSLITPSGTTALLKVETGEADIAACPAGDRARMKGNPKLELYEYPSTAFDFLQYNLKTPFFGDKRVRQAFAHAVNIDAIIKGIYKGGCVPAATSFTLPGFWFANPKVKPYTYDVELSRKLLDEAGWKTGPDGIRAKDGKRFEIDILTNQGDTSREKLVVYLQTALKAIGVEVHPKIVEWNTLFDDYVDAGKFDAFVSGFSGSRYPVNNYYKTGHYLNAGKYSNPHLDKLMKGIRETFDQKKQRDLSFEIQQILSDEQPYTWFVFKSQADAVSKNVKGAKYLPYRGAYEMYMWSVAK